MKINEYAGDLARRLDNDIERIALEVPERMRQLSMIVAFTEETIRELKTFAVDYLFQDNDEEIAFFKTYKPAILSQLYYHRHLQKVTFPDHFCTVDKRTRAIERYLDDLNEYACVHYEFYGYVLSGNTQLDGHYFLRSDKNVLINEDNRFSTGYDVRLAKLMAAARAGETLNMMLSSKNQESTISDLTWTGSKTDLIELLYALHASEVFNKGNADMKKIASTLESVFHVSLGNYYRTFQEIRLRKRGQASFIDKLKTVLLKRAGEFDE